MKNAVLLLLAAGLLFAVSAGLSLWLNKPKPSEEVAAAPKPAAKGAPAAEKHDGKTAHGTGRAALPSLTTNDPKVLSEIGGQLQADIARLAAREAEMEQQREVYRIVLDDIRDEMLVLQKLWQQRAAAAKQARPVDPPTHAAAPTPPEISPKKPAPGGLDTRNPEKARALLEAMPPENASRIIENMTKSSADIDLVVQMLAKMNQRQAAKILSAIGDEKLVMQIVKKLADAPRPMTDVPPIVPR